MIRRDHGEAGESALGRLGLHLERLSDIALTPIERGVDRPLDYARPVKGGIELRNVSFRYAETEPFVLRDVNLAIEPGSFMTIMGPSGGGKTTLLKIMLGLLEPTSGEVLVDGTPLSVFGARAFRNQLNVSRVPLALSVATWKLPLPRLEVWKLRVATCDDPFESWSNPVEALKLSTSPVGEKFLRSIVSPPAKS